MPTFNEEEFNKNLKRLNKNLEKDLSWGRSILMSIVKGAAGAIGATIIAGILIAILGHFLGGVPAIKSYLDRFPAQHSENK